MLPDPARVHLQIPTQPRSPFRARGENDPRIRSREKIATNRGDRYALPRRILDPSQQLLCDKWPNAVQFGERSTRRHQICSTFRPEKGAARGAFESADQNPRALFPAPREHFCEFDV
jgi:hypothetical protein